MKMTSLRQMQSVSSLVGNDDKSLKSCNCIAVEKSSRRYVKLIHLFDNSCKTVCVISSMGSSIYCSVEPILCERSEKKRSLS